MREAGIQYELHDWIAQATAKPKEYFANPDRPAFFEPRDGKLRPMKECQPPYPKLGDLMWFSFVVEIFIGTKNWITKFVPLEFVRVGRVSTDLLGEVHSFVPDEEEMQPRSRLIAGDEIAIGT